MQEEGPQQLLDEIASLVRGCTLCPLCLTRTNAVPGEGPAGALVAFIGEGPGADEDAQGRPFVGRSGKLLRDTIRLVGLREEDVFIGNIVKCRPPENRTPEPAETAACIHYLQAQLVLVRPRVIVTLGATSMNALIDPKLKITERRGKPIRKSGQIYLPTFHPSFILRNRGDEPLFQRDIAAARKLSEQQD